MSSAYMYSKKLNTKFRLQVSTINEFLKIVFSHIADSAYPVRWDFHARKDKLLRGMPEYGWYFHIGNYLATLK